MLLCCVSSFIFIFLHCPLSGPVLTYISLLIIPCMIVYVTNKQEPWTLKKKQSNSDPVIKTITHTCVSTLLSNPIIDTASFFSFNLSENPASNCALFVNGSVVEWSEQRTEFLLTRSGTSLQIKFIHSFLMLGSEGRQRKHCFSTTVLLSSKPYLLFGFRADLRVHLENTTCANRWAGLNRQWCRSRHWSSSVEALLIHTITS